MTTRHTLGMLAASLALLAAPAVALAQAPPPRPAPEPELVFEREIFRYPAFQRRNPFIPLEGAAGGIRYEQLSLIGIMYSPDPTASVAVVSTGGVRVAEDGTLSPVQGDAYNVKVGQTIGNTTIREIQRDRVIVDVEEFGLTDRRTMFFISRRPGGSQ
jgi:hypothetical protein